MPHLSVFNNPHSDAISFLRPDEDDAHFQEQAAAARLTLAESNSLT